MTSANSGTSRVTTAPAATKHQRPRVTPGRTVALAPIVAPCFTCVSPNSCFRFTKARGVFTFVKVALGPTNTSSSSTTPSKRLTWFWIRHPSPITTFGPTNTA